MGIGVNSTLDIKREASSATRIGAKTAKKLKYLIMSVEDIR